MVEFICDLMLYIILRGLYYYIIAANVHAPAEEISDNKKCSFYES